MKYLRRHGSGSNKLNRSFWHRLHFLAVSRLPDFCIAPMILCFTIFFFVTLRKTRKAVASNLAVVLGPCGWWRRQVRIFRTMRMFAWCLTERYERFVPGRKFRIAIRGMRNWEKTAETGKGFILVSAHIGNWELGSTLPSAREGRKTHLVRERGADPETQRFVESLLQKTSPNGFTTHFAGDPALGTALLSALRRGEIVILPGDRPNTGGRLARTTMFGVPIELPAGPSVLARASGAAVLPAFIFRTGRRRYVVDVREPITLDRETDVYECASRIAAAVEDAIRREPHQWFCFAPFFSENRGKPARPPATAPPMRLCAVVPARDEEGTVAAVVRGALQHCREVVVVDDASVDGTARAAEAAGARVLRLPRRGGKGTALRKGFAHALRNGFDAVVTLDADGQHDPSEIPRLVGRGGGLVLGCRMSNSATMPLVNRFTNRFSSGLLSATFDREVRDTQCGFRLIRTDLLRTLRLRSEKYDIETETLLEAHARGVHPSEVEIPCVYINRGQTHDLGDLSRFFRVYCRYHSIWKGVLRMARRLIRPPRKFPVPHV